MTDADKKRVEEMREKTDYTLGFYAENPGFVDILDPGAAVRVLNEEKFLLSIIDRQQDTIKHLEHTINQMMKAPQGTYYASTI